MSHFGVVFEIGMVIYGEGIYPKFIVSKLILESKEIDS